MQEGKDQQSHVLSNTDLAFERTILAENRTLMAWIRTAISLISFGFTIYKFFHELNSALASHRLLTPRLVGIIMITLGLLGLVWGLLDHHAIRIRLKKSYPAMQPSRATWLAMLVLLFGLGLLAAAFLRK